MNMLNYIKKIFKRKSESINFLGLELGKEYHLSLGLFDGEPSVFCKNINLPPVQASLICIENSFAKTEFRFVDYYFQTKEHDDIIIRLEYNYPIINMYYLHPVDTFIENNEFNDLFEKDSELGISEYDDGDDFVLDAEYACLNQQNYTGRIYYKNKDKKSYYSEKKYVSTDKAYLIVQRRKDQFVYKIYESLKLRDVKLT